MKPKKLLAITLSAALMLGTVAPLNVMAVNPYLPLYEHIPDGEPRVFPSPNEGEGDRIYIYGSHDNQHNSTYCGYDHVVWSAPVEDPTDWRYEGESFKCGGLLYAPDVVYNPKDQLYYLYTYDLGHGNGIATSKSPAGPFVEQRKSGIGADPTVLVDDDGKVYAYWGYQTCYQGEVDPDTMALKSGTTTAGAIPSCNDPDNEFQFYEGASIRKVEDKYVLVYCQKPDKDPASGVIHDNYRARLAYAYSNHPLGPWTYGGAIIDNGGELLEDGTTSYPDGNVHGGIMEVDGQWYVFYHRMTNQSEFSRQAMADPINVSVEGDKVIIEQAEMTSQGFEINGLDAYKQYDAGIACYLTKGAYITTAYEEDKDYNPVTNLKDGCVVGYKYLDFGDGAGDSEFLQLEMDIKQKGTPGRIDVFIDNPNNGTHKTDDGTLIGSIALPDGAPSEYYRTKTTIDNVTGKHAVFFVFHAEDSGELCEINKFQFSKATSLFEDDFTQGLNKWQVKGTPRAGADGLSLSAGDSLLTNAGRNWSDYSTDMTISEGNIILNFRRGDEKNFYSVAVEDDEIFLSSTVNGIKKNLQKAAFKRDSEPMHLSVSSAEDQIVVKVNEAPLIAVRDGSHQSGAVELQGSGAAKVAFVRITDAVVQDKLRFDKIYLNGEPLTGFNPSINQYEIPITDGEIPVVTATSSDEKVMISISQADSLPGTTVVKFIGPDETKTYALSLFDADGTVYDFTQGKLPEGWSIANEENPEENVSFGADGVTIVSGSADCPTTQNQLELDQQLQGNWMLETHVTLDKPLSQNWAQYGILFRKDDKNLVRLNHEHDNRGKIQVLWWKDGDWMTNGVAPSYGGTDTYIRLKKAGNNFEAMYSEDGEQYTSIYTTQTDGRFNADAKIRLYVSKQNANNNSYQATFEYVKITQMGDTAQENPDQAALEALAARIGTQMAVPAGDYADEDAVAAKAQEVLAARDDLDGATPTVTYADGHYYLTLKKGGAECVIDPFMLVTNKDYAALQTLIEQAEGLDADTYTTSSWERLSYAAEKAGEVGEDATAYETSVAYDRLKSALDGLVELESTSGLITVDGMNNGDFTNKDTIRISVNPQAELESLTILKDEEILHSYAAQDADDTEDEETADDMEAAEDEETADDAEAAEDAEGTQEIEDANEVENADGADVAMVSLTTAQPDAPADEVKENEEQRETSPRSPLMQVADDSYSFTLDFDRSGYGDGSYQIVAEFTDRVDAQDATFRLTSDRTTPEIDFAQDTGRVTVTDANLDTVTVNGANMTLDADRGFTLRGNGVYQVEAADKAGNVSDRTITINSQGGGSDSSDSDSDSSDGSHRDGILDRRNRAGSVNKVMPGQQPLTAAKLSSMIEQAIRELIGGEKGNAANVNVKNQKAVSAQALKAMALAGEKAGQANGKPIFVRLVSDVTKPGYVESRLYIDPARYQLPDDLQLGVKLGNTAVSQHFERFTQNRLRVVEFAQKGTFGMRTEAAVKLDLTGLDVSSLRFYSYDLQANSYQEIPGLTYFVDANGYLHFSSDRAGTILITDAPFARK